MKIHFHKRKNDAIFPIDILLLLVCVFRPVSILDFQSTSNDLHHVFLRCTPLTVGGKKTTAFHDQDQNARRAWWVLLLLLAKKNMPQESRCRGRRKVDDGSFVGGRFFLVVIVLLVQPRTSNYWYVANLEDVSSMLVVFLATFVVSKDATIDVLTHVQHCLLCLTMTMLMDDPRQV